MPELPSPEELRGSIAFRDTLRRFNERLSDPEDSLRASPTGSLALRDLERELEAKRTRHLLAAWKLREARQAFEAAQKEASHSTGQYRMLQNDAATRMEEIAHVCDETVPLTGEIAQWSSPERSAALVATGNVATARRTTSNISPQWIAQPL
ncbi:MAG: hypothetical protein H7Y38_07440 [Armatimonadetes bacterium]|nr:hypothetical protein [Armatimonadota bacterium]